MKETIEVRVEKEVESKRPLLVNFGTLYGRRVFKLEKRPCIQKFAENADKAMEAHELFLTRNVNRIRIIPVDIVSINPIVAADDQVEIVLNQGLKDKSGNSVEIRCPLSKEKVTKEVTTEIIVEALNKAGNGKTTYFSSGKKLAEEVNYENEKEITKVVNLENLLSNIKDALSEAKRRNAEVVNSYYEQLNSMKSGNVVIDGSETTETVVTVEA